MTRVVILDHLNIAARFCDGITVMRGGRLACHGTPDSVIEVDMVAKVFGVEAALASTPDGAITVTSLKAV